MDVVVVESPAKAKTINKYLGSGYTVLASYGHVRDLPAREGSVRPADDFSMDWEVDPRAQRHIKEIANALKDARHLYLATDPDREGEAISWHVHEVLKDRNALGGVEVQRVVFNEITKSAVLEAMRNPRPLDSELVEAYLARRALDYLVGFTLSPVLWRKLPGSRSAGRVQSVALRLVCERETEIEAFRAHEYWSVHAAFQTPRGEEVTAQLTHLAGEKLDKLALSDEGAASAAVSAIEAGAFSVQSVERGRARRNPAAPFTTSTLQQEASRKLGLGASPTMRIAQRLYEGVAMDGETVGLITYMRTDAVNMAREAVDACRSLIRSRFGERYLPASPRIYKTKSKNAQEAHEAIRPTDADRAPEHVAGYLDADHLRLYELIWKRAIASQMESAVLDQVGVDIAAEDGRAILRATGSVIAFDGHFALYREGLDDPSEDERNRLLPDMAEGEDMALSAVTPEQHFTQPPPRFSEASLVKQLEELGIGRPSTYASILSVLQDREYVRLDKRRFIPEDRGRLVTAFLTSFFERYVQYNFTAEMENQLDDVSGGRLDWKSVLRTFWAAFNEAVEGTQGLKVRDVLEALNQLLGPHFFPEREAGGNPRTCPSCSDGLLSLKLGRYGAFIGCSNYPECRYTRPLVPDEEGESGTAADAGPRVLGPDPKTGREISIRKGPYGLYVQLAAPDDKEKPKRVTLAPPMAPATLTLDEAVKLLALPREVGRHPESAEPITAGIGRYGSYVKHGHTYARLRDDDVLTVGLNRAVDLLAEAETRSKGATLGEHPKDGKPVKVRSGRFGPYLQHGTNRAALPKGTDADALTLERALEILAAKAAAPTRAGARSGGRKKSARGAPKPSGSRRRSPSSSGESS
ncbi:MAG: type I DNA topoisomerase [Rhodospirillales bacterium]|jgi:DNA topoisomerase-1|nr:type I DNA topoisomerase [Rhodospirillales bacterium]